MIVWSLIEQETHQGTLPEIGDEEGRVPYLPQGPEQKWRERELTEATLGRYP